MKFKAYTGITWSVLELTGVLEDEDSHVHFEKCKKHLGLYPFHLTNLNASLNEILSSNLFSYDNDLKGFLLAYKNPKLLTPLGEIFYDTCFIHVDIEAEFYIFRPKVGCTLKGIVNKKGLDHIGVLTHKAFNVSIPKPDGENNWPGDNLEIGQEVKFKITLLDITSKLPYIRGVLDSVDYLHGCKTIDTSIYNRRLSSDGNIENNVENSVNEISEEKFKHVKRHRFHTSDSENTSDGDIPEIKKEYVQKKSKKKFKQEEFMEVNEKTKKDKKSGKRSKEIKESKPEITKIESTYSQHTNNVSVTGEYESNEELEKSIVSKKKSKKKVKIENSQSSIDEDNEKYVEHSSKKTLEKTTFDSKRDIKIEQLIANSDMEQVTDESTPKKKKKASKRKNLDDSDNSRVSYSVDEYTQESRSSDKKSSKRSKTSLLEVKESLTPLKMEELNDVDINGTDNEVRKSPKKRKYSVNTDVSESEVDRNIEKTVTKNSIKSNISDIEFTPPKLKIKKENITSSDNTDNESITNKILIKNELNSSNNNYKIEVEEECNRIKKRSSDEQNIKSSKKNSKNEAVKKEIPSIKIKTEEFSVTDDSDNYNSSISPKSNKKSKKDKSSPNVQLKSPKLENNSLDIETNFQFWNDTIKTEIFSDS